MYRGGDGDDVISLYQGHRRIYDPSNRTVDSFLGETLPYRTLSDVRAGETLSVDRVTGDGGDDSIEVSYVPRAASVESVSGGTVSQISGGGGDDSIRVAVHSALDSAARYSGTTTALIGPTISEIAGDEGDDTLLVSYAPIRASDGRRLRYRRIDDIVGDAGEDVISVIGARAEFVDGGADNDTITISSRDWRPREVSDGVNPVREVFDGVSTILGGGGDDSILLSGAYRRVLTMRTAVWYRAATATT